MYEPIRNRFRRLTALTIAGVLALTALTGCKNKQEEPPETTLSPTIAQTQAPETTAPTKPDVIKTGVVTAQELNVRAGVGISYEVVHKLKQDDPVEIYEIYDLNGVDWGRIDEGWICLVYVRIDGEPLHSPTEPLIYELTDPITGVVIATELNVRTGPSTNYAVSKTLVKGDSITVTELNGNWGKTEDGWVNTIFVYFEGTMDAEKINATVTAEKLNVRSGPSTAYESLRKLEPGDKVQIIKQVTIRNVTWGYIGDGWICMEYVEQEQ